MRSSYLLRPLVVTLSAIALACGGGDGEAEDCTVEIDPQNIAARWGEDCRTYVVPRHLRLDKSVSVAPGTTVIFEENAGIEVPEDASFSAVGTEEAPIVFRGRQPTKGFWSGIFFGSVHPENELTWVRISDTGASGYHYTHYAVRVVTAGSGLLKMTHSIIENASHDGLVVGSGGRLGDYASNTFRGIDGFPLSLHTPQLGALDSASRYGGTADAPNGKPAIHVAGGLPVTASQTWRKQDVPYRFADRNGHVINDASAVVTVEPGTRLEFQQNEGIEVRAGALKAVGTADAPIVFTGVQPVRGFWSGLAFRSLHNDNHLEHVEVSYGGASGYNFTQQGIRVTNEGNLTLRNAVVRENDVRGIVVERGGRFTGENISYSNNGSSPDHDLVQE